MVFLSSKSRRSPCRGRQKTPAPARRLQVEALEDRMLPSVRALPLAAPAMTGNGASLLPSVSADGRYTAFASFATNLVPGQIDPVGSSDVFLHDRVTGTTTLVSHASTSAITTGNFISYLPLLSNDGRYVVFLSGATNLVVGQIDTNMDYDVFLFDREAGTTSLVSRSSASATTTGNRGSGDFIYRGFAISNDGRHIAFQSLATNLVAGLTDVNNALDVFLFTRRRLPPSGRADIVVAPDGAIDPKSSPSAPPRKIYRAADGTMLASNHVYEPTFTGGVRLAFGDVDGAGGEPQVKMFDGLTGVELAAALVHEPDLTGGLFRAAG